MSEKSLREIREVFIFVPNGATSYWLNEKDDGTSETISPEEVLNIGCLREVEGKALVERLWTKVPREMATEVAQREAENEAFRDELVARLVDWRRSATSDRSKLIRKSNEPYVEGYSAGAERVCNLVSNFLDVYLKEENK